MILMVRPNSEIERVLKAVCRGYRTRKAIAKVAKVSHTAAQTYLTRLIGRNMVTSTKHVGHVKQYHMKDIKCLLADFWRSKK